MLGTVDTSAIAKSMLGAFDSSAVSKVMLRNLAPAVSSFAAAGPMLGTMGTSPIAESMLGAAGSFAAIRSMLGTMDTSAIAESMLGAAGSFAAIRSMLGTVDMDSLFTSIIAELDKIPNDTADVSEASLDIDNDTERNLLSKEARVAVAAYMAVLFFSVCAYLYLAYPTVAKLVIDAGGPATWAIAIAGFIYERLGDKRR